ncbi:MAG: indolepyruvate ferredoxin oxidoreductase subunit alpha [Coriobacteriales bacterium]|nr:indolepyruvate ferredoxin oxidoreductase subunit alpha [Coriobacteriales bacterium]
MQKLLMGNEAIALGALVANIDFAAAYPGTPSSEILETIAKEAPKHVHVEWSTNEKVALEAAIGASWAGGRAVFCCKQVGLNVASDALMTLSYLGCKGGLVLVVCDDPGPISSQTEQDTRKFAQFAKVPVLEPSSPQEAYIFMQSAFELSEKFECPVILRPTTRICHGSENVNLDLIDKNACKSHKRPNFDRLNDAKVIFPNVSYECHIKVEKRAKLISKYLQNSSTLFSSIIIANSAKKFKKGQNYKLGLACSGIAFEYAKEACKILQLQIPILKVSSSYPFPDKLAASMLKTCNNILVCEELDYVIENELLRLAGQKQIKCKVFGKLDNTLSFAGELSSEAIYNAIAGILKFKLKNRIKNFDLENDNKINKRGAQLCAGCPHRASFLAVKEACKGKKVAYCGDIGCYTLGVVPPIDTCDTCLCMGADITVAQGLKSVDPALNVFSFIGDSTFFASGIPGIINAVYNAHDQIICILDNSSTAMTGNQPHPGLPFNARREPAHALSIEKLMYACDIDFCKTVNPFDFNLSVATIKNALAQDGVRVIIFKAPCVKLTKKSNLTAQIDNIKCKNCSLCFKSSGCGALSLTKIDEISSKYYVKVDEQVCTGCSLCANYCKFDAIKIIEKG